MRRDITERCASVRRAPDFIPVAGCVSPWRMPRSPVGWACLRRNAGIRPWAWAPPGLSLIHI
eukprot:15468924-Alexandrium_andersonii.AAC.1